MKDFIDYINSQNEEPLRSEQKELYSSFELVRTYYQIKSKDKEVDENLLEGYKAKITKAIYPNDRMQGGLDINKVDEIVKQLDSDLTIKYYIEVCLHSIEECTNIACEYGGDFGEDFYVYFEELFENIVKIIVYRGLENEYKIRLEEIANSAFDGYGHYDQLKDTVSEYIKD